MMTRWFTVMRFFSRTALALTVASSASQVAYAQAAPAAPDLGAAKQVGATQDEFVKNIQSRLRAQLAKTGRTASDEAIASMTIKADSPLNAVYAEMKTIYTKKVAEKRLVVGAAANAPAVQDELRKDAFREAIEKSLAGTKVPSDFREVARRRILTGASPRVVPQLGAGVTKPTKSLPEFSWKQDYVPSAVRNQGTCQSCWAFAAVGVAESSLMIQSPANSFTNGNPNFSEQYILNAMGRTCATRGFYVDAWEQVMARDGVPDEALVPFPNGISTPAGPHPHRVGAYGLVSTSADIPSDDELKQALCDHGPLAVCVDADEAFSVWQSDEVFPGTPNSQAGPVNHAVIIVGWTKDGWVVRNSWGDANWGKGGYSVIAYGTNNIGYAAAWATYGSNGQVVPQTLPTTTTTKIGLLKENDRVSLEIWRNLALFQAGRGDGFDSKLFNLRPDALKAETGSVQRAAEADRPFLKTKKKVKEDWAPLLP